MDSTYRDWKNLPAELLSLILKFAAAERSKVEACDNTLVCKAWLNTAQEVAYSDITIKSLLQLKKFHEAINHSPHLGIKVRNLQFLIPTYKFKEADKVEASNRLTSLLTKSLPNLVKLKKTDLHECVPNLLELFDSQLKHLKRLQQPNYFGDLVGYEIISSVLLR